MDGSELNHAILPRQEIIKLAVAARGGDSDAMAALVAAHERMILQAARRLRWLAGDVPLDDLRQEGRMGLMHAAALFDPARGTAFSTYAYWWIEQYIRRGAQNGRGLIRVPIATQIEQAKVKRSQARRQQQRPGRVDGPEQAALAAGLSARRARLFAHMPAVVPLELAGGQSGGAPEPRDREDWVAVQEAWAHIPPLQHFCIRRYYIDGATYREIGRELSRTGEYVRQTANQGLRALRQALST